MFSGQLSTDLLQDRGQLAARSEPLLEMPSTPSRAKRVRTAAMMVTLIFARLSHASTEVLVLLLALLGNV